MKVSNEVKRFTIALLVMSGALAMSDPWRPQPVPPARRAAGPVDVFARHRLALRDSVAALARAQVGRRYVFGGTSPAHGFDCSGLVRWVYANYHLTPPRTARQQAELGKPVPRERLRPGDLVTFGVGRDVSHIGIYVGDGKMVHASSVAGRVIVSAVDRPPSRLIRPYAGARRVMLTVADARSATGN